MQTIQGTVSQSLRVVQAFLDARADRLAAVNKTAARQKLDDRIVELTAQAATQTGSALAAAGATQQQ